MTSEEWVPDAVGVGNSWMKTAGMLATMLEVSICSRVFRQGRHFHAERKRIASQGKHYFHLIMPLF